MFHVNAGTTGNKHGDNENRVSLMCKQKGRSQKRTNMFWVFYLSVWELTSPQTEWVKHLRPKAKQAISAIVVLLSRPTPEVLSAPVTGSACSFDRSFCLLTSLVTTLERPNKWPACDSNKFLDLSFAAPCHYLWHPDFFPWGGYFVQHAEMARLRSSSSLTEASARMTKDSISAK